MTKKVQKSFRLYAMVWKKGRRIFELRLVCCFLSHVCPNRLRMVEIGQLLLEKNKQLTEEFTDLDLTTKQKVQLVNRINNCSSFYVADILFSQ